MQLPADRQAALLAAAWAHRVASLAAHAAGADPAAGVNAARELKPRVCPAGCAGRVAHGPRNVFVV